MNFDKLEQLNEVKIVLLGTVALTATSTTLLVTGILILTAGTVVSCLKYYGLGLIFVCMAVLIFFAGIWASPEQTRTLFGVLASLTCCLPVYLHKLWKESKREVSVKIRN